MTSRHLLSHHRSSRWRDVSLCEERGSNHKHPSVKRSVTSGHTSEGSDVLLQKSIKSRRTDRSHALSTRVPSPGDTSVTIDDLCPHAQPQHQLSLPNHDGDEAFVLRTDGSGRGSAPPELGMSLSLLPVSPCPLLNATCRCSFCRRCF